MSDLRLVTVANHILTEIAAGLEAEGISVPDRRYVFAGEIAHDFAGHKCVEQFAVTWSISYHGLPGAEPVRAPMKCAVPLSAGFTIALLRCVPIVKSGGNPPSAGELQDSGEEIMTDAMTLAKVVVDLALAGDLVPFPCVFSSMGNLVPYGPQGGVGGSVLEIVAELA